MKTLKTLIAVLTIAAVTTATSCKKNDGDNVKPAFHKDLSNAMPQDSTGLSGGQDDPTRPPHH